MTPSPCPICGKLPAPGAAAARTRPFCSARCAEIDLGRWLTDRSRIPGPLREFEEEEAPE